jgi:FAD/FMN-containing dehydrogenase
LSSPFGLQEIKPLAAGAKVITVPMSAVMGFASMCSQTPLVPDHGLACQEAKLWRLREDTDVIYRVHPGAPSYDLSVPLSAIETYATDVQAALAAIDPTLAPYLFGHLADGNLHIVLNRQGPLPEALAAEIEHVLYRNLQSLGGSFSAEHGVGSKRIDSMIDTTDHVKLALMTSIKNLLDPEVAMNRGKVLPASSPMQG